MTFRLGELAELVGATVEGDAEREIEGVASLDRAEANQISFLTNSSYAAAARLLGISRARVSQVIRLLDLPVAKLRKG